MDKPGELQSLMQVMAAPLISGGFHGFCWINKYKQQEAEYCWGEQKWSVIVNCLTLQEKFIYKTVIAEPNSFHCRTHWQEKQNVLLFCSLNILKLCEKNVYYTNTGQKHAKRESGSFMQETANFS